jgi:hypothetical protein
MFIETYYAETAPVPGSTSERMIPYPELSGEDLTVWRQFLPMRREIGNLYSLFIPDAAIAEINKAARSFERIEIWSRTDDPMAVGVIGEEKPRYFSIVRWGDAKITLAQVKRKLRIEKWLLRLTATGGVIFFLVTLFVVMTYGWLTAGFLN